MVTGKVILHQDVGSQSSHVEWEWVMKGEFLEQQVSIADTLSPYSVNTGLPRPYESVLLYFHAYLSINNGVEKENEK